METSTLLLVDDELTNVKVLVDFLKDEGFKILVARNGYSALEQLEYARPDMILLDVMMPGIDGFETCLRLKKRSQTRDIPVIFMTALSQTGDKVRGFEVGGVDYITKPIQKKEVLARITTHLSNRHYQQQLQQENQRFQALADATFEGIIIHDQGSIVELNPVIEAMFGYARRELLGKHILELVPSAHQERSLHDEEPKYAGAYETEGLRKDGAIFPLELHVKPFSWQDSTLRVVALRDIAWRKTLEEENRTLRATLDERDHFGKMVGKSPAMKKVYEYLVKAAASGETVIIYGETGTGKELAARMIFDLSEQFTATFLPVNCGAIQEPLFESDFFGHRKGSFTGADHNRSGYFEQTEGGTLFLDEVGEFSLAMQTKLLRVLEDRSYTPVGRTSSRIADVRIIAATNRDLKTLAQNGRMRADFFQRIHVIVVRMPPLRQRKEDIPLLINAFLADYEEAGKPCRAIPSAVMERLCAYDWPGNVRELFNELRRYMAIGELELGLDDADLENTPIFPADGPRIQKGLPLNDAVEAFEAYYISHALEQYQGQKVPTAEALGVDRKTLYNKLKKLQRLLCAPGNKEGQTQ